MSHKPLSERELAMRWGVTLRTLQNWRAKGCGPKWSVIGKNTVRYLMDDIIDYEQSRRKPANTKPEDH